MNDLVLRGSEYQSFLNCRKQWYYQWIEEIEPNRPDGKLFFGTVFHKWAEDYYKSGCNKVWADNKTEAFIRAHDLSAMEQTEIDALKELLAGVTDYYHEVYGSKDKQFKVLGTEVEFVVKLQEGLYFTGTIDLVYETEEGKIRFMDHKTVSSLSMYEEKAVMDRQISRYWWALQMIADGIGRIKGRVIEDGVPKDIWVRWSEIEGKKIDGFDYNLIAKDFPKEPKVLASGKLSKDKSQKTTLVKYLDKIRALGHRPEDYNDILAILAEKPDPWLKRVNVLRTEKELLNAMWEFSYTAGDLHDVKMMIKERPHLIDEITYRNIGHHCMNMCSFQSICKTAIEGGNVSLVKNLGYRKRENLSEGELE